MGRFSYGDAIGWNDIGPLALGRELRGLLRACRPAAGPARRPLVVTLAQRDTLIEDGLTIEVIPAWEWLSTKHRQ